MSWASPEEELLPYGHHVAKVDYMKVLKRLEKKKDGKYVDVHRHQPRTPLGEGKSTSTMGLLQGMGKRGLSVTAAHPPALRRSDHEHQGLRRRRRPGPVRPP